MRYRFFDFSLESDVAFEELAASLEPSTLELRADAEPWAEESPAWFHEFVRPDETPWLRVGRSSARLVMDFCGAAVLRYHNRTVEWRRRPGTSAATFRHLLLDQGLPLVAAYEGATVLHAACAIAGRRAIAIAGPAGVGKSTLSAALARRFGAIVGDDATTLVRRGECVESCPAYAGVRLWPDAAAELEYEGGEEVWPGSGKRSFPVRAVPQSAVLSRIFVLVPTTEAVRVRQTDLVGRDAMMALIPHAFVLDPYDRGRLERHFASLGAIASRVSVSQLLMPHRFDAMADALSLLESALEGAR